MTTSTSKLSTATVHVTAAVALAATMAVGQTAHANQTTPPDGTAPNVDAAVLGEADDTSTRTVTLLTGHEFEVSTGVDEKITVTQAEPTGDPTELSAATVHSTEKPGEVPELTAHVASAAGLVEDGIVDADLFDLTHLLDRGHTADSPLPVTVHFAAAMTASEAEAAAEALPASGYIDGTATDSSATVAVAPDTTETFWQAVTQPRTFDPDSPEGWAWKEQPPSTPRELADGIAGLTLDGAPLDDSMGPTVDVPTYTVLMRFHASDNPDRWVREHSLLLPRWASATPVTDRDENDQGRASVYCEDELCQTLVYRFTLPEGVYSLFASLEQWRGQFASSKTFEPEVVVNGDVTLDYDMDDFTWVESETPRRSELAGLALTYMRHLPGGLISSTMSFMAGLGWNRGVYLGPSQTRATTGSFNMVILEARQEPAVSMRIAAPGNAQQELLAEYPPKYESRVDLTYLSGERQRLEVVDAGLGTDADFAQVDVEGKLALVRLGSEALTQHCYLAEVVVDRAHAAGAVGVVVDPNKPRDPDLEQSPSCWTPVKLDTQFTEPPKVPVVSVQADEGETLRSLIAAGRTVLEVDSQSHQQPAYLYELVRTFWGGVPESFDQTIEDKSLMTHHSRLHGTAGSETRVRLAAHPPIAAVNGGTSAPVAAGPAVEITEYVGPSLDVVRSRKWEGFGGHRIASHEPVTAGAVVDERFNAGPATFGPSRALNGDWHQCSFCRRGDILDPFTKFTFGSAPHHNYVSNGILPGAELTTADGEAIPMSAPRGLPVYELPAERQQYTFRSDNSLGQYEWTFWSDTAGTDTPPMTGLGCNVGLVWRENCGEPVPMIYVRYDAPVGIDNLASADSRHTITVDAYHHVQDPATIDQVDTDVSFDGGATWQDTRMRKDPRDGTWLASFQVPSPDATDGFVTLRTRASDVDGNSTDQTRTHAYGLK